MCNITYKYKQCSNVEIKRRTEKKTHTSLAAYGKRVRERRKKMFTGKIGDENIMTIKCEERAYIAMHTYNENNNKHNM